MVWYFAYGSNMNAKRMMDRVSTYTNRIHAILKGYGIIFNKVARKNPKKGYANVVPEKDSIVEGILYEIHDKGLEALDAREGYPEDYGREIVIA